MAWRRCANCKVSSRQRRSNSMELDAGGGNSRANAAWRIRLQNNAKYFALTTYFISSPSHSYVFRIIDMTYDRRRINDYDAQRRTYDMILQSLLTCSFHEQFQFASFFFFRLCAI